MDTESQFYATKALGTGRLGWVSRQPVTNRSRLGMPRFHFQYLQIMLARFGRLAELLRVEISERQMRPGFIRDNWRALSPAR